MSRVCVKGLPKYATEQKVIGFFAGLGDITDVKIARTKDGRSRQFAFVGFKTEASASRAVKVYNQAFMDTAKLTVEPAQPIGADSVLQRAWSRHTKGKDGAIAGARAAAADAKGPSADGKAAAAGAAGRAAGIKNKERLQEFLSLMRAPSKSATWANDTGMADEVAAGGKPERRRAAARMEASGETDSEGNDSGDDEDVNDIMGGGAAAGAAAAADGAGAKKGASRRSEAGGGGAAVSDMDFLRSKVVGRFDDDEDAENGGGGGKADGEAGSDDDGASDDEGASPAGVATAAAASAPAAASSASSGSTDEIDVGETGRLFVRNLPYACSEEEVRAHFGRWGRLADVRLPSDAAAAAAGAAGAGGAGVGSAAAGKHRGYCYVTYVIPEQAVAALAEADGHCFQGRILHVLPARPEPVREGSDGAGGGAGGASTFKGAREAERRAQAGSLFEEGAVWNTLFIRPDTTIAAVAEALGIAKGDVLDREAKGASMAVRAALAETQVVAETKEFLRAQGVALPCLQAALEASAAAAAAAKEAKASARPSAAAAAAATAAATAAASVKRSATVILVKNLPFACELGALRDLFSRHGSLARVVLPPSRALAVVEFTDPRAAKRAFSALAYSRFQRAPLYLEWAPAGIFGDAPAAAAPGAVEAAAGDAAAKGKGSGPQGNAGWVIDTVGAKRSRGEAEASGTAAAPAAAPPKRARKGEEPAAAAEDAAPAEGAEEGEESSAAAVSASGNTIYVKNLSWDTTQDGLRALFATVGPLRAVRIPLRRNPKYRSEAGASSSTAGGKSGATSAAQPEWLSLGYGFVEFAARKHAEAALRTLQGKQLDGHALQLKLSTAAAAATPGAADVKGAKKAAGKAAATASALAGAADSTATKLLVRNLAFEASKKDLQDLFAPFGTLKTLRIPRKFNGSNRGFAFVEFLSHAEAVAAMEALSATHLYGRHLVLEWAEKDEGKAGASGAAAAEPA
jgi:multiple RNA-binding domain-containing protein 1